MLFEYSSDNLIYRILSAGDAPEILGFYTENRDFFEKYEPDKPSNFYTEEYQTTVAKLEFENFLRGRSARFFIFRKSQPGIIIGSVSFSNIVRGSFLCGTIGYKIHKNHLGLGYATEAVCFLSDILLSEGGLHRIEAYIHPENKASIALAEKCGFIKEGIAREYVLLSGKWVDHLRYALIR